MTDLYFRKEKHVGFFFGGGGKMFVRNLFVFFFFLLGPKDPKKNCVVVKEGQGNKC